MADGPNRWLGDTPGRTIVKLVVISLVVGFVMSMIGLSPWDLVRIVKSTFRELWYSGFEIIGAIGDYLIVGAMVVVPVFVLLRILNWRKS